MMEETWIEPKYDRNPLTGSTYTSGYVWHGDSQATVRIDRREWEYCQDLYPWRLEVVGSDWFTVWVCRQDLPLPSYALRRFEADALAVVTWFRYQIGARLILTAQVWGLAYVPLGAVPSVSHLFGKR